MPVHEEDDGDDHHATARPRRKGVYILPNLFTLAALFGGFYAIVMAMNGRYILSCYGVFCAMVLDSLDGRVARMTNTQSAFGAEMDSLSDMVSFGAAPALIVYEWALKGLGKAGWGIAFFYCACAALRLARFNTALSTLGPRQPKAPYFVGVPTPAGAALSLLPLLIDLETGTAILANHPYLVSLWVLGVALLMVSRIPTPALTSIRIGQRFRLPLLAAVGIAIGATIDPPWALAIFVILAYLLSIPLLYWQRNRLRGRGVPAEIPPAPAESPPVSAEQPGETDLTVTPFRK
jgi:CDP-diacylglycerol--serine O-phosphatidyltransferase